MLAKSWSSSSENCIYKCMTFDMHDKDAAYVLYRICQTWRYEKPKLFWSEDKKKSSELETVDMYIKVKSFCSKDELDMWCAIHDVEYDIVSQLNVIEKE